MDYSAAIQNHCLIEYLLGGAQIFFEKHWRHGKGIANGVEAIAGIVHREIICWPKCDTYEVLDRVVVFGPIEPADGDTARVRTIAIHVKIFLLDPAQNALPLRWRG